MIRSTIFNLLFYSFTFIIAGCCWIAARVSGRRAMWYVIRFWGKSVLVMLRVILGAKVEVRGREHFDPSRCQLIVAKHQSELDIVMLGVLMWEISAVAMEELTKLPFFGTILKTAGTIIWNGPVGVFEFDKFGDGTRALAEAIADSDAFSVAGGGDTLAAIDKYGVRDGISYISTGGGAFLEFVEGKVLPAVEMLERRAAS